MECVAVCSCCGKASDDIILGHQTIFDEFDLICKECLSELYKAESEPTALEVAESNLKALNVSEGDIYGFYVDNGMVLVDYFELDQNGKRVLKTERLVECYNNDEAIDVLCQLTK